MIISDTLIIIDSLKFSWTNLIIFSEGLSFADSWLNNLA
jgi:hypothetical protein